jgi:hypothetical protein
MSADVVLTPQTYATLESDYQITVFATEDGNNPAYLTTFTNSYSAKYAPNATESFGLYQYDVGANSFGLVQPFLASIGFTPAQIALLSLHGDPLTNAQASTLSDDLQNDIDANPQALKTLNGQYTADLFTNNTSGVKSVLDEALSNDPAIAASIISDPVGVQRLADIGSKPNQPVD